MTGCRPVPPTSPGTAAEEPGTSGGPADESWLAVLSLHGDLDDEEWALLTRPAVPPDRRVRPAPPGPRVRP